MLDTGRRFRGSIENEDASDGRTRARGHGDGKGKISGVRDNALATETTNAVNEPEHQIDIGLSIKYYRLFDQKDMLMIHLQKDLNHNQQI